MNPRIRSEKQTSKRLMPAITRAATAVATADASLVPGEAQTLIAAALVAIAPAAAATTTIVVGMPRRWGTSTALRKLSAPTGRVHPFKTSLRRGTALPHPRLLFWELVMANNGGTRMIGGTYDRAAMAALVAAERAAGRTSVLVHLPLTTCRHPANSGYGYRRNHVPAA